MDSGIVSRCDHNSTDNEHQRIKAPAGYRLPPYGRSVFARMADGWRPSNGLWLYCGAECYAYAKEDTALYQNSRGALAIPDDLDLATMWLPHLANLPTLIRSTDLLPESRLADIIAALMDATCGRICVLADGTRARFAGYST